MGRYERIRIDAAIADAFATRASVCVRVHAADLVRHVLKPLGKFAASTVRFGLGHAAGAATNGERVPTFGLVTDSNGANMPRLAWADVHGDSVVQLRSAVKERTTVGFGCSLYESSPTFRMDQCSVAGLESTAQTNGTASILADLHHRIVAFMHSGSVDDLVPRARHSLFGHAVIQAHIWGPVRVEDVKSIVVRAIDPLPAMVHDALVDNGLRHIKLRLASKRKAERWIPPAVELEGTPNAEDPTVEVQLSRPHTLHYFEADWCGDRYLAIAGGSARPDWRRYRRLFIPCRRGRFRWLEATDILYDQAAAFTPMAVVKRSASAETTLAALVHRYGRIRASRNPQHSSDCEFTWQQSLGLSYQEAQAVAYSGRDVELRDLDAARRRALQESKGRAASAVADYYLRQVFQAISR